MFATFASHFDNYKAIWGELKLHRPLSSNLFKMQKQQEEDESVVILVVPRVKASTIVGDNPSLPLHLDSTNFVTVLITTKTNDEKSMRNYNIDGASMFVTSINHQMATLSSYDLDKLIEAASDVTVTPQANVAQHSGSQDEDYWLGI